MKDMGKQFAVNGFGALPGSTSEFGGIYDNPQDIRIQLQPAPDRLVTDWTKQNAPFILRGYGKREENTHRNGFWIQSLAGIHA